MDIQQPDYSFGGSEYDEDPATRLKERRSMSFSELGNPLQGMKENEADTAASKGITLNDFDLNRQRGEDEYERDDVRRAETPSPSPTIVPRDLAQPPNLNDRALLDQPLPTSGGTVPDAISRAPSMRAPIPVGSPSRAAFWGSIGEPPHNVAQLENKLPSPSQPHLPEVRTEETRAQPASATPQDDAFFSNGEAPSRRKALSSEGETSRRPSSPEQTRFGAPREVRETSATGAPFSPEEPAYRVAEDGIVTFDPKRLTAGLTAARNAGLIDAADFERLLRHAQVAEKALAEREQFLAHDNVASKLKALGYGAGKGAAFMAGAPVGVEGGAVVGAFGGPLAEFTVPIGAAIGGMITGGAAAWGADKIMRKLGEYDDTVKSFSEAADAHPYYDAAGNLVAFSTGVPRTVLNLSKEAAVKSANGATRNAVAKSIATQVGKSMAANVAIDTIIKEGARSMGWSDEGQTLSGAAQAAIIGAFVSGHGMKFRDYAPNEVGEIMLRVEARHRAGVPMDAELRGEHLPPGIDPQDAAVLAKPLTRQESEVANQFAKEVLRLRDQGRIPEVLTPEQIAEMARKATAQQALRGGQPYGETAVKVDASTPSRSQMLTNHPRPAPAIESQGKTPSGTSAPAAEAGEPSTLPNERKPIETGLPEKPAPGAKDRANAEPKESPQTGEAPTREKAMSQTRSRSGAVEIPVERELGDVQPGDVGKMVENGKGSRGFVHNVEYGEVEVVGADGNTFKMPIEDARILSPTNDAYSEKLGKAWQDLVASRDDMFAFKKTSSSQDLATLLHDIDPESPLRRIEAVDPKADTAIEALARLRKASEVVGIHKSEGDGVTHLYLRPESREIIIDSSQQNRDGGAVYQAVFAHALNTGWTVIPDPIHLNSIGELRRTSHMLSSALRFGTTKHMLPDQGQGITGWEVGDAPGVTTRNIGRLAEAERRLAQERAPQIGEHSYDLRRGEVTDRRSPEKPGSIGAAAKKAIGETEQNKGVGPSTFKRSLFTKALREDEGALGAGERPSDPDLKETLYAAQPSAVNNDAGGLAFTLDDEEGDEPDSGIGRIRTKTRSIRDWNDIRASDLGARVETRNGERGTIVEIGKVVVKYRLPDGKQSGANKKNVRVLPSSEGDDEGQRALEARSMERDPLMARSKQDDTGKLSAVQMKVRAHRIYAQHRAKFESLGIARPKTDASLEGAIALRDGRLIINPRELEQESASLAARGLSSEAWLEQAMIEEWLHAAQIAAETHAGRDWGRSYAAIWNDPLLDGQARAVAARHYPGFEGLSDAQKGVEFVRLILSEHQNGTTMPRLRRMAERSSCCGDALDRVEAFLAENAPGQRRELEARPR